MGLEPAEERVEIDQKYSWELPLRFPAAPERRIRSVWYLGLPLSSAHRGSHSGGGALLAGVSGQERYQNEGTVYPHASLVELVTYHQLCFPEVPFRYIDLSHYSWEVLQEEIAENPPDVVAFSTYTATVRWAFIVAATIKRVKPDAVVVFGNDHAGVLHNEILTGRFGGALVDFISTGNNGPFTMMGLLYALRGQLDLARVPSLAYRQHGIPVNQAAETFPLDRRLLPDYSLILSELENWYDNAFKLWYADHYDMKRMITMPLDGGCNWGRRARRRCKHCSIQGLTPKTADPASVIASLETAVGELGANVYAAGDSTLGFSSTQWGSHSSYLDQLAEGCANSQVLRDRRFMLAYGLVSEFLQAADLCKGFLRTWNVGIEAFDPKLLRGDSKGINRNAEHILEALELARALDYRLYVSGILGLPGTTLTKLATEVDHWIELLEAHGDLITTISVAAPALVPGSRMYWEAYQNSAEVRSWHGEILPCRRLTEWYIERHTDVTLADVEAALDDLGRAVISDGRVKFGGYMLGGSDEEEENERRIISELVV